MPACTARSEDIPRSTRIMIRRPRDPECPESSVIFQSGSAIRTDAGMGFITLCARAAVSGGSRARACWLSLGQYAWGGPRSVGGAVSSPGFRRPVRGLVRATLLRDDFGQTNACCASLVIPTRGPERLEG